MFNTHGHKEAYGINALLCLVSLTSISWTGLAPYKLPRALDSLLMYQQPSSTTLHYSYLGMFALIKVRLRNETGKLQAHQRVHVVLHLHCHFLKTVHA